MKSQERFSEQIGVYVQTINAYYLYKYESFDYRLGDCLLNDLTVLKLGVLIITTWAWLRMSSWYGL